MSQNFTASGSRCTQVVQKRLRKKRYAEERDYEVVCFPADWNAYGKADGYRRNVKMAEYALEEYGALIAFWNGKSRGTKHMIDVARKKGLSVRVVKY